MYLIFLKFIILLIFSISFLPSQVNTEIMRDEEVEKTFSNQLKLDFGYQTSENEIFDLWLSGTSNYYLENNLHIFLILNYHNGYISKNETKEVILNRGFTHLRLTKRILPHINNVNIEFFLQTGFNDFILIKDRKLFGSGLRTKIIKKEDFKSFLGLGIMRELEKYDLKTNSKELLFRQTSYATIIYQLSDNTYINNILYFQPSIKNMNDFRLLSENRMNFKINDVFSINITIDYRYDNEPHGNSKKSYFQINNGFEFDF
ncbi:MAG: hypothetical protein CMF94_01430 [Candidatus Marinimicrobia bacterium]|nr:hypothetical protein [Candidatus Neomarinimicrobiota bacterium]